MQQEATFCSWKRFVIAVIIVSSLVAVLPPSFGAVVYAVNSGGSAASPFVADTNYSGGATYGSASFINTSLVVRPAPVTVYQTERYGNFTYTFPGLISGSNYQVRLHFAELYHTTASNRLFNVLINDAAALTGYDIFSAAGGKNIAVIEEFGASAGTGGVITVQFQNGTKDNAKCSAVELVQPWEITPTTRLNVDIDKGSPYTGTAAAPDAGTVWNVIQGQSTNRFTLSSVKDSQGTTTPYDITIASGGSALNTWSEGTLGNPIPSALMSDYLFGNTYTVSVSGLPAGNYLLYVYAHGDQANQNSTVTVAATNGGASGTTGNTGTDYRNITAPGALGYAYLRLQASVNASGTLFFTTTYLNGFQLIDYPKATITEQPPPNPVAVLGSEFTMSVSASGMGSLTYQWRKNGTNLLNGATGNGSTITGATNSILSIANIRNADAGNYDVVIMNPGGAVVSFNAALIVSATPQPPSVFTQPSDTTVLAGQTATFRVVANGSYPMSYQWYRNDAALNDGISVQGSTVSGSAASTLTISNTVLGDAGSYHVMITNSAGSASSSNATLTVNRAPVILAQPQGAIMAAGSNFTVSAVFDSAYPAPLYWWESSADAVTWTAISGATNTTLPLTGSLANNGFYRIVGSNSVGVATSGMVYFGIPSAQTATLAPGNNATSISIDQPLRVIFPAPPRLGLAGVLRIRDAADDSVAVTVDRSQFVGYSVDGITVSNAALQTIQGDGFFYLPIAIHSNEVWISLSTTQRLSYGKTYYVTMDAGLLLDSQNAAYGPIAGSTAWRFSTKGAGPAASTPSSGPATITVGMDGAGDFATLQGALDWVPISNILARTINVAPGFYYGNISISQNRRFVTVTGTGASRRDVKLFHPCPAASDGRGTGVARIISDDITFRHLTLDTGVYLPQRNPGGAFAPDIAAFPGRISPLLTTGKRLVIDDVLIQGGQDTIYNVTGVIYYYGCEVWGSVDFIYGDALSVFDHSVIVQVRSSGNVMTAPSTPSQQPFGEVFLNCRIPRATVADGYPYDVSTNSSSFMRPWRKDAHTAVINCELGSQISAKAWSEWGGRETTCRAREYGSTLVGGGTAPSPAERRAAGAYWLNTYDPDYDPATMDETASSVAPGIGTVNRLEVIVNPADYTLDVIFGNPYFGLGTWRPVVPPRIASQPTGQSVDVGSNAVFTVAAMGVPDPFYQWMRSGTNLVGQTNATLTVGNARAGDAGNYSVVVSNSAGSVVSDIAVLTVLTPEVVAFQSWQRQFFGSAGNPDATAGADPDHDGMTNDGEYQCGTNPTNAVSVFSLTSISQTGGNVCVTWTTAGGRSNVIQTSNSLTGQFLDVVGGMVLTAGLGDVTTNFMDVNVPTSDFCRFYRIRLAP